MKSNWPGVLLSKPTVRVTNWGEYLMDRRAFLASAAATAFAGPALAQASSSGEAAKMNALFDRIMQERFQNSPGFATRLGLDKGPMTDLKGKLNEISLAARARNKARVTRELADLRAIDRKALSGMDAVNYDTIEFTLAVDADGYSKFNYGADSAGEPYVLSQLTGSYQQTPDFLDTQHSIETAADAEAYLSRLQAFARNLDGELEIARHDLGLGVLPPDFAIDRTLASMGQIAGEGADKSVLVQSVVRRTAAKNLAGDWSARATKIYEGEVVPALNRQIEFLKANRAQAVHDAGCWRLPKGDEYYAVSLKGATTSGIPPEDVHQTGLELVKSISAEIDVLLKGQGMTQGSVGERLKALGDDPKQHYPNTDEGKEQLLAMLNGKVEEIRGKLPPYFGQLPKAPVEIRRVPKTIEAGAPRGYYNSPTLDGSRPGIYWINLRNTAESPTFTLTSLTYHESIPGHHLQLALSNESDAIPLIRKATGFSGYSEGWALYSEQLAVEMGMYEKDPLGHVGQLQGALFRAVRMVVDSGMHHKRWSSEQAVKYFVDTLGWTQARGITEIERYSVWPGQASSYMVGKIVWLRTREKAKAALGSKFDLKAFHNAGLLSGSTPLTVLETAIDNYVAAAKTA